jgi:hypothetical protein
LFPRSISTKSLVELIPRDSRAASPARFKGVWSRIASR